MSPGGVALCPVCAYCIYFGGADLKLVLERDCDFLDEGEDLRLEGGLGPELVYHLKGLREVRPNVLLDDCDKDGELQGKRIALPRQVM